MRQKLKAANIRDEETLVKQVGNLLLGSETGPDEAKVLPIRKP